MEIRHGNKLDISGVPGWAGREPARYADQMIMTGYNQISVNWAREMLHTMATRFDFNEDLIHQIPEFSGQKLDIVLSSIESISAEISRDSWHR